MKCRAPVPVATVILAFVASPAPGLDRIPDVEPSSKVRDLSNGFPSDPAAFAITGAGTALVDSPFGSLDPSDLPVFAGASLFSSAILVDRQDRLVLVRERADEKLVHRVRTYDNPPGRFGGSADTMAFSGGSSP